MPLRLRPSRGLFLALLVLSSAPLHAQSGAATGPVDTSGQALPTTPEARREQAKLKYQQGADAYSAGSYSAAVDLFLEADRLAPSAPLSFNVARAYSNLGDEAGALRWYRDYLRRAPNAQNGAEVRAMVVALATALKNKGVQQLTVLSTPAGATVTIDGHPLGVAPWTGELSPGQHELLLTLRGYLDGQRRFMLPASEAVDVSLQLEKGVAAAPVHEGAPGPRLGLLPWLTLGAGAAALAGSLVFEVSRRSAEDDAHREVTQLGYQSRLDAEQDRQAAARVLLGVGGALVAAGGVMLLLDTGTEAPVSRASAGFMCLSKACALSAQGRF